MADSDESAPTPWLPLLVTFRGIGQVFFQENALSGLLFLAGILVGSRWQAGGLLLGAAVGTLFAWVVGFDRDEWRAGIYGFNAALVGIATLFFFQPGVISFGLLVAGAIVATLLTRLMRTQLPFPTYTTPFILTTWVIFFIAPALGAAAVPAGDASLASTVPFVVESVAHGIGQVMFQATLWSGVLFLAGIAVGDWRHALFVLAGSIVGMLIASFHLTAAAEALDPERLVVRTQFDNVALGLYGYNATLAALALFLARRSILPSLVGMALAVPLTELFPRLGLPALTAPFVVATWIVLLTAGLEDRWFKSSATPSDLT